MRHDPSLHAAPRAFARRLPAHLAGLLLPAALLAASLGTAAAQTVDPIQAAIQERASETRVTRSFSLADLGIDGPVVLQGMDARRDVYLPVPAGVPLQDASIVVDGDYLRGDGGRTTMVLSVDSTPIFSRRLEGDSGSANTTVAVDGRPRETGFVRFGMAWSSVIGEALCADERGIGNVLKIQPSSRFTYSYDAGAVRNLATAWTGMPGTGSLLVPAGTLSKETYDTAWRLGLALESAGKRLVVKTLPSIGDEVDLSTLDVPAALRSVAPFSSFVGVRTYRLRDASELGALLVLPGSPVGADVAVADSALLSGIRGALDALGARLGTASQAFTEWRAKAASLGSVSVAPDEVSLQFLGGRPIIAVGGAAGAKATQLFDSFWRTSLASSAVTIRAVDLAPEKPSSVMLSNLGPADSNLDVLARGDWVVSFDLAAATGGRSLPNRLNLDVAAAPGASSSEPVVAVFLNDVLLAAKRLEATGHPEHLTATVPPYALAARNVLRVTFQRQPVSDRCRETPQAFPVSVLRTSHFELGGAIPSGDFLGVISAMASGGKLVVPDSYLATAKTSLPRVVRAAAAAGMPAGTSTFDVSATGAPFRAAGGFLALDVPVQGVTPKARVDGDRLVVGAEDKPRLLDITGLKNLALVQAVRGDDARGILWQSIGPVPMTPAKSVRLSRGDVALVGVDGTLTELSASGAAPGTVRVADTDGPAGTLQRLWQNSADWGLPLGIGAAALFFLLLIRASRVRRRGN
ncbi:cellulose biosynthesis cyclic di-GMP-binding regulatory protein BcsB [Xanthobacter sp. KR7-65]|uniref:cellulose biosynthesis cyclic di-GMP-binding regulatory protein BcsB n=1 Tax=Xanthobacter sp. KR7-65 TaxID=3156612 RepID=UPI0032B572B2